jgi:hypothetical protein
MYSLQEITSKFKKQLDRVERHLDANNSFHPSDITMTPHGATAAEFGLKPAEVLNIKETLQAVSLSHLIREFLVKSGTTGLAGAAYLIPDKIYDILFTAGAMQDVVPLASTVVSCPGSSLKIDVEVDGSFKAHYVGGGGEAPSETINTTQVEITPKLFNIRPAISQELIEDSQFDLIERHLFRAGEQMGEFSTQQFLARLITGTHGDGTQNTVTTTTADKTYLADLAEAWNANYQDKHPSDVIIMGPEPLTDILSDDTVSKYSDQFHTRAVNDPPLTHGSFMGMTNVVVPMNESYTGDGALYISSKWHSFVLRKSQATLTVRKRWMKIDNYSDPVRDLVGAVISSRQEASCIYNDASCEITEGS